jgi:hypothetical protein
VQFGGKRKKECSRKRKILRETEKKYSRAGIVSPAVQGKRRMLEKKKKILTCGNYFSEVHPGITDSGYEIL